MSLHDHEALIVFAAIQALEDVLSLMADKEMNDVELSTMCVDAQDKLSHAFFKKRDKNYGKQA